MLDKKFNGNLRSAIDLLEATQENLNELWNEGSMCLTSGEIEAILQAVKLADERTLKIKELIGERFFGKLVH